MDFYWTTISERWLAKTPTRDHLEGKFLSRFIHPFMEVVIDNLIILITWAFFSIWCKIISLVATASIPSSKIFTIHLTAVIDTTACITFVNIWREIKRNWSRGVINNSAHFCTSAKTILGMFMSHVALIPCPTKFRRLKLTTARHKSSVST